LYERCYGLPVTTPDPLDSNRWGPLFALLRRLDGEIEQVYVEAGFPDFRTRFTKPLVLLARHGSSTIKTLARQCQVTHSAMSQTVTAMRAAGLVDSVADPADGRARLVALTERATAIAALGEAEWAATEAALEELEAETPYAMSRLVHDLEAALARRSFGDRLRSHLEKSSCAAP
jgi:DNA-binding MarR family transcriptional regulator